MKKISVIFVLALFLGTITFAQTQTPQINKTQKKQIERIKEGAKNGELTKKETKTLLKEQKYIQKEKKRAVKDGKVTKAEKTKIKEDQARASKNIAVKKHNPEKKINN